MNFWDIIIVVLIAAGVCISVIKIVRDKKKRKTCCGNCTECNGCVYK